MLYKLITKYDTKHELKQLFTTDSLICFICDSIMIQHNKFSVYVFSHFTDLQKVQYSITIVKRKLSEFEATWSSSIVVSMDMNIYMFN